MARQKKRIRQEKARQAGKFALTIILAVGVVVLVMFGVIPQLTRTIASLMISIANFYSTDARLDSRVFT